MSLSSNNFAKNQPSKSGNAFAEDVVRSTNTFVSSAPAKNLDYPSGENLTIGDSYGGDFASYGDLYADGWYGGLNHFNNRTDPPVISH